LRQGASPEIENASDGVQPSILAPRAFAQPLMLSLGHPDRVLNAEKRRDWLYQDDPQRSRASDLLVLVSR
jgi:hypothetical protein